MGLDVRWAINKVSVQLKVTRRKNIPGVPQTRNLDGIPMNIYGENSASNFCVQSECEWTLLTIVTHFRKIHLNMATKKIKFFIPLGRVKPLLRCVVLKD